LYVSGTTTTPPQVMTSGKHTTHYVLVLKIKHRSPDIALSLL